MRQCHMGDSRGHMFAIIQQSNNARIQRLERSTIVTVLLANSTCILKIPGPSKPQGAHLKVAIGEHVGQTKGIVVFLCKKVYTMMILSPY